MGCGCRVLGYRKQEMGSEEWGQSRCSDDFTYKHPDIHKDVCVCVHIYIYRNGKRESE